MATASPGDAKTLLLRQLEEVNALLQDRPAEDSFSLPGLVTYLNRHLPEDLEDDEFTIPIVRYLRDQGVLTPTTVGEGELRKSWRYSMRDAKLALLVELMKVRAGMGVREVRALLQTLSPDLLDDAVDGRLPVKSSATIDTPLPRTSTYTLLRNRTLGMILAGLSRGEANSVPGNCIVAIRASESHPHELGVRKLEWQGSYGAEVLLEYNTWNLAAAVRRPNLYFYRDFKALQESITDVQADEYRWWMFYLCDIANNVHEVLLGLPDISEPAADVIDSLLGSAAERQEAVDMSSLPGVATLLRMAFGPPEPMSQASEASPLSVLAHLVANATNAWDYCAILVPEQTKEGRPQSLEVRAYSERFPRTLRDAKVSIDRFVSGWCYAHNHRVVIEQVRDNDLRIASYREERPSAVAAVPARARDNQPVGVVYVGRRESSIHSRARDDALTEELLSGLQAIGHICGDMIARDQVETDTIRGVSELYTPHISEATSLREILTVIAEEAMNDTPLSTSAIHYYIVTLNIESYDTADEMATWLRDLAVGVVADFLSDRLWIPIDRRARRVVYCQVAPGQVVFALPDETPLSEVAFKRSVLEVQDELGSLAVDSYVPQCFLWSVPINVREFRQHLENGIDSDVVGRLENQILEALWASPSIRRAHDALFEVNLIVAGSEFEKALRSARNSWYIHKHLAEVRALEGEVDTAIEHCQEALKLNRDYASAHCLLADCLAERGDAKKGDYEKAVVEYERAIDLEERSDFLVRYAIALTSIPKSVLRQTMKKQNASENNDLEPYEAAIERLDRAKEIDLRRLHIRREANRRIRTDAEHACEADYCFRRGFVYLQAHLLANDTSLLDKAIREFFDGKALNPDSLRLAQAYLYAWNLRRSLRNDIRLT